MYNKDNLKYFKVFSQRLFIFVVIILLQFNGAFSNDTLSGSPINFHFQQTIIMQYHPDFHAEYSGLHSLLSNEEYEVSVTSTFFFGLKLSPSTEFYLNPELTGGQGLSGTYGIAGFPNGEVYRVGNPKPEITFARALVRQTINLSNTLDTVNDGQNQFPDIRSNSYMTITAGKFSITDIFDDNNYSHEPRTQFMNWALMSAGAWDYPANTKGYTWGIALELVNPSWAVRLAGVMVPTEANQSTFDTKIGQANGLAFEFEKNYSWFEREGSIKFIAFLNNARMGNYKEALLLPKDSIDITQTRQYGRNKYGFCINVEQDLSDKSGLFARLSWNDGQNETWAFTEIDQSLSFGALFHGGLWSRETDRLGLAFVLNGISKEHRDYLAAGGYGFIIGDGKLNYALETIFEAYYSFFIHDADHFWFSPDYQFVLNPAYNKDRGPVHILGFRIHIEF
ncbi:MAG: carbohydrate porin [FCB group bacterium]|jgi:high affinity Mn2+ porin